MNSPIASARPIEKLETTSYPRIICLFDTESTIDKRIDFSEYHTLRLGVVIFVELDKECRVVDREKYFFYTKEEFWDYINAKAKQNNTLYIYAHNMKYDAINVDFNECLKGLGYEVPYPIMNNAFIARANKGKKKIKLVDTFNYVKTSVEEMGKKVGIEKIKLGEKGKIDFNAIDDMELFKYCENDVAIIEKWMIDHIQFLHKNDLGSLKDTIASTAINIYRHSFINEHVIYYHKNDEILKIERDSYRGGMVNCFKLDRLKKQKYYLLDINSMYVTVMSRCKLPLYPITFVEQAEIVDLIESIKNNYVIADVLIDVGIGQNNGKYGVKSIHERLVFPEGKFRVTLHKAEIEKAIEQGIILEVFNYVVYKEGECLRDYANYFSEMKKNALNKTDYEISKLYGNSGYGRFGLTHYENTVLNANYFLMDNEEEEDKAKNRFNKDGIKVSDNVKEKLKADFIQPTIMCNKGLFYYWNGKYYLTTTDGLKHTNRTNVALAGAVTAYARIMLSEYIEIAGIENIWYTDTDSLAVNEIGYQRLSKYIDSKELGKLKLEYEFNRGVINAPKNYTFSCVKKLVFVRISLFDRSTFGNLFGEIGQYTYKQKSVILSRRDRSKGIPIGSINIDGVYHYMRFTTFKENMRDENLKGRIWVHRKNTLEYTKGVRVGKHDVKPYLMDYLVDGENEKCQKWENKIMNIQTII